MKGIRSAAAGYVLGVSASIRPTHLCIANSTQMKYLCFVNFHHCIIQFLFYENGSILRNSEVWIIQVLAFSIDFFSGILAALTIMQLSANSELFGSCADGIRLVELESNMTLYLLRLDIHMKASIY